jgi:hypothetical protein
MPSCPACHAQIVQPTSDQHSHVRKAVFGVTELVFGNSTDLDASNRMLDPNPRARQFTIVALLARC